MTGRETKVLQGYGAIGQQPVKPDEEEEKHTGKIFFQHEINDEKVCNATFDYKINIMKTLS